MDLGNSGLQSDGLLLHASYVPWSVCLTHRRVLRLCANTAEPIEMMLGGEDMRRPNRPCKKGKGSPYSINERRVLELIPVLGSQPAGDVSHKPGGRLSLLSVRPAVTPATLKRAATSFAAW